MESRAKHIDWFELGGDLEILRSVMYLTCRRDVKRGMAERLEKNISKLDLLKETICNNNVDISDRADAQLEAIFQEYLIIIGEKEDSHG